MTTSTQVADSVGRKAIIAMLTAPGGPFELAEEVIDGVTMPIYRNAPPSLASVMDAARAYAAATFLVAGDRRLSYTEAFAHADNLALALVEDLGVKPGDHVAIIMRNGIEWVVSFIATVRVGAVAVLVNSRSAAPEMRAALEDVGAICALVDDRRAEVLRASGWGGRIVASESCMRSTRSGAQALVTPPVAPDDTACIFFTSGTTGRAKGAMLSHRAIIQGVLNGKLSGAVYMQRVIERFGADAVPPPEKQPQMAVAVIMPLFHISGMGAGLLLNMMNGGKLTFMPRWSADEALRLIEKERLTVFTGVPTMIFDILRSPLLASTDTSSLRSVGTGGQGLPVNLFAEIRRAFPNVSIGGGWGMTETCGAVSVASGDDYFARPDAAGYLLPTWCLRVLDEAGEPVARGEVGELVVRGASAMRGYWGLPDATADAVRDGWLHTGDLGRIDEDDYVFIVDRKKDMVISAGENIYCAEVEGVIGQHADAIEVTSFGLPDDRLGERLVAVVCVAPGSQLDAPAIRAFTAERLAGYKVPSEIIVIHEPLPRNALGKIEKRKARERWGNHP